MDLAMPADPFARDGLGHRRFADFRPSLQRHGLSQRGQILGLDAAARAAGSPMPAGGEATVCITIGAHPFTPHLIGGHTVAEAERSHPLWAFYRRSHPAVPAQGGRLSIAIEQFDRFEPARGEFRA
jgi:hypothetical protein